MRKFRINKKTILIILGSLIVIGLLVFVTFKMLNDENKLSISEREWLTENIDVVQSVNVLNNVDIYGKNGSGVFYDFINNLSEKYNVKINPVTFNNGENVFEKSFKIVNVLGDNDVLFNKEHYVLISKDKRNFSSINQLSSKRVGILSSDETFISNYLSGSATPMLNLYESYTMLFSALNSGEAIDYAMIPLEENLTSILSTGYAIDYHFGDLNKYFVYEMGKDDVLSSVIKKHFAKWSKDNLKASIDKNELNTFIRSLSIADKELDNIKANVYNYGFINNSPYEILTGGKYGGIVSEYLVAFANFSGCEFRYTKYKNFKKFTEAIVNDKVDMFYNYYNLDTDYYRIDSLDNISFVIIAKEDNDLVINSVSSLVGKEIYVLKSSLLEKYFNSLGGIEVKTYDSERSLKKIISSGAIVVLDEEIYNYYSSSLLRSYNVRYQNVLSETYNFYVKGNDTFNLLLSKYIETIDPLDIKVNGIYNHSITLREGSLIGRIAEYSLIVILLVILASFFLYKSTKKIKIAKKIKKEDKMKYIDQLTSLKNRNYLSENLYAWNKNTIYPQATIIIDLNQVQVINDSMGYEKGDMQIKAAANVLIKTQLDNTDIMRTDGNEFLVYLVGYQEKQVVSYIRKLYKEFKNLPFEYGAAIGYSMILDDMKTIEDSINESVEDMKIKKEELEDEVSDE